MKFLNVPKRVVLSGQTIIKIRKAVNAGKQCVKYAKIRAFSNPYFPVNEQNYIRIFPYLDRIEESVQNTRKYGYDSVHIQENTDQRV